MACAFFRTASRSFRYCISAYGSQNSTQSHAGPLPHAKPQPAVDYVDIDRFTLINTNDINNIIKLGDAIHKFGSLTEIELQKGDAITFIKKGTIWWVEIGLGSKMYIPSLIPENGSTGVISIDSTGATTTVKYNNMKAWSDTTVPLNAETLNNAFPNVSIGFQVVCYNANRIYEKANVLGDWIATEIKQVPLGGGAI